LKGGKDLIARLLKTVSISVSVCVFVFISVYIVGIIYFYLTYSGPDSKGWGLLFSLYPAVGITLLVALISPFVVLIDFIIYVYRRRKS
jgi:hypothetical protein